MMNVKRKRYLIIIFLVICSFFLIRFIIGILTSGTPETVVERFAKRCIPDWDAVYEALITTDGNIDRGDEMPEPLLRIFKKDRALESIDMIDNETVNFWFKWYITGPEQHTYFFWQKNDDYWKNHEVIDVLSWREKYNEHILTEEKENGLKVTGFGSSKKGYIDITRIQPCWFLVEAYYPT